MKPAFRPWWVPCVLLLISGCASHEVVPSSGPRKPTTPQQVKLYQKFPKKYEQLATVSVAITPEMKLDERGDATPAYEALKAKAAALGANGLLLYVEPTGQEYLVTAGYQGTYYRVPVRMNPKTAFGQAIYVLQE
jgi:hypothetical protein